MLRDLHRVCAWVLIVGNAVAGTWALAADRLPALRRRALWWVTAAAEVSVGAQAVLGAAIVAGQDREAPRLHSFYGFLAVLAVAILYSYRHPLRHRLHLLYGLGGLFVTGLGIRALVLPA